MTSGMNQQWQHEVQVLEQDLRQLARQASRLPDRLYIREICEKNVQIEALLSTMAITQERCQQILRKLKAKDRAENATAYWARKFLTKLKTFAEEFLALQTRKMWLKLLKARFSEAIGEEPTVLEARHLVDLVQRRQKLAQIELQLQHEIDQTRSYRNQLRMQYEAIGTADENWVASGSMQARLGIDLQDAAEHPTTRALRDLMKLASIPVQYPHEKSTLSRINHELMTKSDNLVAECAQLAANFVKKGQTAIDSDRLNQFKCMISEVTDLNRALDHHMQHLLAAPTVQSKPKVVQNAEKKGKTPVLEI